MKHSTLIIIGGALMVAGGLVFMFTGGGLLRALGF